MEKLPRFCQDLTLGQFLLLQLCTEGIYYIVVHCTTLL